MKKNKRGLMLIFIIIIASLLPVSPFNILNEISTQADTDSVGSITGQEVWDQNKTIDKYYTVQKGATLIIKEGTAVDFLSGGIVVYGKLIVEGTVEAPVKISADPSKSGSQPGYSIGIGSGGEADIRNAEVSGGGMQACLYGENTTINTAYACTNIGAINVTGGMLRAGNVSFHDNAIAVSVSGTYPAGSSKAVLVNRSEFLNSSLYDVVVSAINSNSDFRYNWWGSDKGPSQECYMGYDLKQYCYYDKIDGDFDFSNWRTQEKFHDPVIIIPGILGSWKWTDGGDWQMDPVFKTYDSLEKTFELNGYEKDKDLFVFPYQWRASNLDTAKLLQKKIHEITQNANWPKVDVVAHSMGGLVVRQYIESADYQDDIDQVVLLGTPNKGAPKVYPIWEDGEASSGKLDLLGFFLDKIFNQESKEAGFKNIFDYLHNEPIASVRELLPDYDYLYDVSSDKLRSYSKGDSYPKNDFLDNLNTSGNLGKLSEVSITNIAGKQDKDQTVSEIKVDSPTGSENSLWADGQPVDGGLISGEGDGTVPLSSAEAVPSDEQIEINSAHTNLPGAAQDVVYKTLTGGSPQVEASFKPINNEIFFFVFSPVDIQVIAPDGKHWIGKNIKNLNDKDQIAGAYYTGSDTVNEFAAIPEPEDGEYMVVAEGTGSGDYKVEVAKISEAENNPGQASEATAEITGTASPGKIDEAAASVSGDTVTTKKPDTTPPEITATLDPEPNASGWNNTDVKIHFAATDDQPGMENTTKDVTLSEEGENQSVSATFTDAAGNSATKTVGGINIDKTTPKTTAAVAGTVGDNGWYTSEVKINLTAFDNLSGVDKINYSLDGAGFQTGNNFAIKTDGQH